MPRHSVVNRRNLDPLVRKSLLLSDEALERISEIASALQVSQGSLVDTALRHLAGLGHEEIVELLRKHGHLSDAEYEHVRQLAAKEKGG